MSSLNGSRGTNDTTGTTGTSSRPHYADNPSLFPTEGGCACGQIRYRLRKATATLLNASIEAGEVEQLPPAAPTASASADRPDDFLALDAAPHPSITGQRKEGAAAAATVVEPRITVLPAESGRGQAVARCPLCGVMVWSYYSGAGPYLKVLRVATLDRAFEVAPDNHIHMRSARDFVRLVDGKPAFETSYIDPNSVLRPENRERYARI